MKTNGDYMMGLTKDMASFEKHYGDLLWKFQINEFFPENDPLARDILRLITVDEDLSNVERFKEILEEGRPDERTDEITRTKWNRAHFFLARMRLGFLHNAWKEIVTKEHKDRPSFKDLIAQLGEKAMKAYDELCEVVDSLPRTKNLLSDFRNQASFHYGDSQFQKGLACAGSELGEIIVNQHIAVQISLGSSCGPLSVLLIWTGCMRFPTQAFGVLSNLPGQPPLLRQRGQPRGRREGLIEPSPQISIGKQVHPQQRHQV